MFYRHDISTFHFLLVSRYLADDLMNNFSTVGGGGGGSSCRHLPLLGRRRRRLRRAPGDGRVFIFHCLLRALRIVYTHFPPEITVVALLLLLRHVLNVRPSLGRNNQVISQTLLQKLMHFCSRGYYYYCTVTMYCAITYVAAEPR